jgi:GTP cyclohydrolase II
MELARSLLTTPHGTFTIAVPGDRGEVPPFALIAPTASNQLPLVRIQSECITGHVFSSFTCDCRGQLDDALTKISERGGALIYLRQEGRGIGLYDKIRSYVLQREGLDTVDANVALGRGIDERGYEDASALLIAIGVTRFALLTNNPAKESALRELGLDVAEVIAVPPSANSLNEHYLRTKVSRLGHTFDAP